MNSRQGARARHRRRSFNAEAVAPWLTLSVILLLWWAGAKALNFVTLDRHVGSTSAGVDWSVPKVDPVDPVPPQPTIVARNTGPTISANTMILGSDIGDLRSRVARDTRAGTRRRRSRVELSRRAREAAARGHRYSCAARNRRARGGRRNDREVVYEQCRRVDGLSVRSGGEVRLLLRASRQLRAWSKRGADVAQREMCWGPSARRATRRKTRRTCISRSRSSIPTSGGPVGPRSIHFWSGAIPRQAKIENVGWVLHL